MVLYSLLSTVLILALSLPLALSAESKDNYEKLISEIQKRHDFTWFGRAAKEVQAEIKAPQQFRIISKDGEAMMGTSDFVEGRLNAVIWTGAIIGIKKEGQGLVEGVTTSTLLPYLGLTEADAKALAETEQVPFRVLSRDGKGQPATTDHQEHRINVSLTKGKVTTVSKG